MKRQHFHGRLRILVIHPSFPPGWQDGGPVVSIYNLCRSLRYNRAHVIVLTSCVDHQGNTYTSPGLRCYNGVWVLYCRRYRPWNYCFIPAHIPLAFRLFRWADMVYLPSIFNFTSLYANILRQIFKTPVAVSGRGNLSATSLAKRSTLKLIHGAIAERPLFRSALFVHCTSELEASWVRAYTRVRRILVLPNGVVRPRPDQLKGTAEKRGKTILFLGRFSPLKNIDKLIEAFKALSAPDLRLQLVGADRLPFSDSISQMALEDARIEVVPFVPEEKKWDVLRSASLLVLPSNSENFGNVVVEALTLGVPVLVSEGVGCAPIVQRTRSGMVVPPTVAALTLGMKSMLENLDTFRENARNAGSNLEELDWDRIAASFLRSARQELSATLAVVDGPSAG